MNDWIWVALKLSDPGASGLAIIVPACLLPLLAAPIARALVRIGLNWPLR